MKDILWPVDNFMQSKFPEHDRLSFTDNAITCSNVWQQAVDDELVDSFLGTANDEVTLEYAKKKLSELIQWHIDVATDPKVNGGYELRKVEDVRNNEVSLGDVIRDRST